MTKYSYILVTMIICILFTSFMYFLNDVYINIRMKELKLHLQKADQKENNIDHISLVMKYTLHRKLYENQISIDEANMIENHVYSLSKEKPSYEKIKVTGFEYATIPMIYLINFYRFFMDKPPIHNIDDDPINAHLQLAYYFERNRLYNKALKNYELAQKKIYYMDRTKRGSILLHEGYCHALLGNYSKAKKKYLEVINNYSNDNIALTATILLKYLEGFQSEYNKIMKDKTISISKGVKLYNLLAYNEALRILDKLENTGNKAQIEKIKFYKARCYYEVGEHKKSIKSLLDIIIENPKSQYSKLANKTLYMIGSQNEQNNEAKEISIKINTIIKDDSFNKMMASTSFATVKKEADPKEKIVDTSIEPAMKKKVDKLVTKSNNLTYIGKKVSIKVNDGNLFYGIVKETNKNSIFLLTSFGEITVNKKNVIKITISE